MDNDLIIKTIFYHSSLANKNQLKLVNKMWYSNKDHIDPTAFLLQCASHSHWKKYQQTYKYYRETVDPTVDNNFAIRYASNSGHPETVKFLLADPRVNPAADNNTAIRAASSNGHAEIVKLLLDDPRTDPTASDNWAIRRSSQYGHTEIVKLLLADPRANPAARDNYAIIYASSTGHAEI